MKELVNRELERALRHGAEESSLIQALMEGAWRGDSLLILYAASGNRLRIRMQGMECVPAFTSCETLEAFRQLLLAQGRSAVCEERKEAIEEIINCADCALALDAGQPTGALVSRDVLLSIMRTTERLTGGRTPQTDFPLMRLHMETVGNGERARRAGTCACFHCGERFAADEISRFADEPDGRKTAVCPCCGVDAVLTDMDALPLTDQLVSEMNERFFGGVDDEEDGVLRLMYMQCMRERIERSSAQC